MSTVNIVLLVILAVLIVGLIVLYFLGKKAQKKRDEQEAQLAANAQTVSMLIIDKKRMRLKDSGLPQVVIDQTPKMMRHSKLPIVKAKVGPKVMSLIADEAVYDLIPLKKEVKATVSGIYITKVTGVRGPLEKPQGKKSFRARMQEKAKKANAELEKEKAELDAVKSYKEQLETAKLQLTQAQNDIDYEKAAKLKYETIPQLEKKIQDASTIEEKDTMIQQVVDEEMIAKIVSRWTHIEVSRLMSSERQKLLHLEDALRKRVIGQDEALKLVSDAIMRSKAQIQDENRPLGSFLFLGPTGVGKTEVAKALAEQLFDDENKIVRIDMSEYMEKFSVSRLIGAPPGYVGYDEGGQLTEAVRRNPYSIVLLDEVEKAHPDVFNILLQILDDGRITDSKGVTVDFKNTIIIMTSNLGSQYAFDTDKVAREEHYREEVRNFFKPEFVNRIDEVIIFNPLNENVMKKIADKFLSQLAKRLNEKDIKLEITDKAKERIISLGTDEAFGARPMKRHIQRTIETMVARKIIEEPDLQNKTIVVDADDHDYVITVK